MLFRSRTTAVISFHVLRPRLQLRARAAVATTLASRPGYLGSDLLPAFLGRMSREKRPDRAIEIAIRAGVRLRLVAKVDKMDRGYFDEVIKPMLDHPLIEFIGQPTRVRRASFSAGPGRFSFPSIG